LAGMEFGRPTFSLSLFTIFNYNRLSHETCLFSIFYLLGQPYCLGLSADYVSLIYVHIVLHSLGATKCVGRTHTYICPNWIVVRGLLMNRERH